MKVCNLDKDLINSKPLNQNKNDCALDESSILCRHCKRTSSNGIRCLGMCVADNDY